MHSPGGSNASSNSSDRGGRSASSASTTEEKKRLNNALKKRRLLIEKIKEERAKVIGLSRVAALSNTGAETTQKVPAATPLGRSSNPNVMFPNIGDQNSLLASMIKPQQLMPVLPNGRPGDWKKSLMEMSTFQSIALQQALSQQIALRNLVCMQQRQASAPPAIPTTALEVKCDKKIESNPFSAQQMIELLKGTKNLEIRQENGCWSIGSKGNRNHHCHGHCCQQQAPPPPPPPAPAPAPVQPQPVQYEPPPPPRKPRRERSPSPEERSPRRRRQRRSPSPRSPRVSQAGPTRIEVNVPQQQLQPQQPTIIQQAPQQPQGPVYVPYPVQQQVQQQPQQPLQPQQPIIINQPEQPRQQVIHRQRRKEKPRKIRSPSSSSSSSSSSPSSSSTPSSSSEEEVTEKRVTFQMDKPKKKKKPKKPVQIRQVQQQLGERCETPPRRQHRIRAKVANLMWPGIGISWWMRQPVIKGIRRIFYVAWLFGCARRRLEMRGIVYEPVVIDGVPDYLTFEICLKDIQSAVVGVYLNMHGPIRSLLDSLFAADAIDLRIAFTRGSDPALKEIKYLVENVIFNITDIQPSSGALGTQKRALLQQVIREAQLWPSGELWQMEKDRLGFDYTGRVIAIGDREAMILILHCFLKPLIMLLVNPMSFGWQQSNPNPPQAASLRIIYSIFAYLWRAAISPRRANNFALPVAAEISSYLIPDQTLAPVLYELQPTLDYADNLLREWSLSYVAKLRMSSTGIQIPSGYTANKAIGAAEPFLLAPDPPELPPLG